MFIFWVVTTSGVEDEFQCFGENYCLRFSPEDGGSMLFRNICTSLQGVTTQKTIINGSKVNSQNVVLADTKCTLNNSQ
jgi:hypothetical protein